MSRRRLLLVGDSHLAGVGDPRGVGWIGRVLARCKQRGRGLASTSLGQPADTSLDLLSRWTNWSPVDGKPAPDTRAVLAFGLNDTATHGDRPARVSERRSLKVLGVLLDEMAAAGLRVFVVGPAPVSDFEHRERIERLVAAFAPVCEERRVPYADLFEGLLDSEVWLPELEQTDGVHPGPAGYQALAELAIEAGLVDWLCDALPPAQGLPHRRGPRFEPAEPSLAPHRDGRA